MGRRQPSASPYNPVHRFPTFVRGDATFCEQARQALKSLDFCVLFHWDQYAVHCEKQHIVVQCGTYLTLQGMQDLTAQLLEIKHPLAHKIAFIPEPLLLRREQLLLGVELGVSYTACGVNRDDGLRQHLKTFVLSYGEQENLRVMAEDVERAIRARDLNKLQAIEERIQDRAKTQEDGLKLLLRINEVLDRPKKIEFCLKKILEINPQSLYAANALGRFYLRHRNPGKAIDVLEKLSKFHELNTERLFELGNAYLNVGEADKALLAFDKGQHLAPEKDTRFQDGKAKAELLRGQIGPADPLRGKKLSSEVLAFLNMRAILAMRANRPEEGFRLYETAVEGAVDNAVCKAKLQFNRGLAFARQNELEKAKECLLESAKLGGKEFSRAKEPLQIVNKVISRQQSHPDHQPLVADFDNLTWESLTPAGRSSSS